MEELWPLANPSAHFDHLAYFAHRLINHIEEAVVSEGTMERKQQSKSSQQISMDRPAIARWAFILGLALAVIIALVTKIDDWVVWLMILVGLYAGWEFVAEEQEHHFFLVAISLVFFSQVLVDIPSVGKTLTALLTSMSTFFGAMVIALVVRNIVSWITGMSIARS
jgi:hypothetical protein